VKLNYILFLPTFFNEYISLFTHICSTYIRAGHQNMFLQIILIFSGFFSSNIFALRGVVNNFRTKFFRVPTECSYNTRR